MGREGLLAGGVVELLRSGFVWVDPIDGREAGRGFSCAEEVLSWGGLAGAGGLSGGWAEEDGGSAFLAIKEVSEK